MKSSKLRRVSLRAKIKGNEVIIVLMNPETDEIQYETFPIHLGSDLPEEETSNEKSEDVESKKDETKAEEGE